MAKQTINVGTNANPTGDSLKNAFTKVNANFTELYNALGLADGSVNVGAFEFSGSTSGVATMTTTDSSAILIDQAVTVGSNLTVNGDVLPGLANSIDLGSSSRPWRSLYVSNNTIYIGGTAVGINQSGQLTVGGAAASTTDRITNGTARLELSDEAASRLSLYNDSLEKSRIQINGNDLLLSSLAGGVVLAATDGVGGEWRFKTNGNLESTGGNFLSAAETPAVFGSLNSTSTGASSGTVTLKSGIGNVDGGSIYIEAGTGGSGNDGEVAIRTGSTPYEWLFDNGGNLTIPGEVRHDTTNNWLDLNLAGGNVGLASQAGVVGIYADYAGGPYTWLFKDDGSIQFPDMSLQSTAYTGTANIARNIESENDVSIKVNLSDSTQRIWRFGEDGDLTLPYNNQITVGGAMDSNSINFVLPDNITGGAAFEFAFDASNGFPALRFPDGSFQTTAWGGGRFAQGAPAHSYGEAGDQEGDLYFDENYIYYCINDYSTSNGIASVTISTPIPRNDSLHWDPATTVIEFATPTGGVAATGTPVFDGSNDLIGININTAGSGYLRVADGGSASITDIFIIQTGGVGGNSTREIRNGLPAGVTISLTTTHIWKRVAWSAGTW